MSARLLECLGVLNWPHFHLNARMPGQELDAETGLLHNGFRDYDPASGGYVESDPLGLAAGWNTYAYVGGDPVGSTDSFGLYCKSGGGWTYCSDLGGPSFLVPTPSGFKDFSNDDTYHHSYDVHRDTSSAKPSCVFMGLPNNPTPDSPRPATARGTSNNAPVPGFPNNSVTSYLTMDINSGQPLVVNMTGGNSAFKDGYVAREVLDGVVHTYGEGNSFVQSKWGAGIAPNWAINQWIWGSQMSRIVSNAKNGKCGCDR
jgi:RHS repeat-associated protein